MPKSAVTSIKKGRAQVFFTPDTGLIYTSPNTIEMGDLTQNLASAQKMGKRARRVLTQVGKNSAATPTEVVKLTFDNPDKRDHYVKATRKKAYTIAKTEGCDKSLKKVEELDSPTKKLYTLV